MIPLNPARRACTAYTVTLVSLAALVSCSSSDSDAPDTQTAPNMGGDSDVPDGDGSDMSSSPGTDDSEPGSGDGTSNESTPGDLEIDPGDDSGSLDDGAPQEQEPDFEGGECEIGPLPTFEELVELRTLPDPFTRLNGERITTRTQWSCRQQEISALAERFIYGENPPPPESVTGSVSEDDVTVNVENQGNSVSFSASITMPEGVDGPVPFVVAYAGGAFTDTFLAEGVAVINYNVGPVSGQFDVNPNTGAFHEANPGFQDTGNLVAWAWGVSRIIDVIEQQGAGLLDAEHIGVFGCSFAGKGAFAAGAFDERIDLTIPYESGMAGVAAFRLIAPEQGAEVLRNAYEWQPWAGEAYGQFLVRDTTDQNDTAGRARDQELSGELMYRLPVDTHEVIGMIAPRGLLVLGNPSVANLAPVAEQVTSMAGAEIYAALGVPENMTYRSRTDNGNHCAFRAEYEPLVQANVRKFLKDDASASTGGLDPAPQLGGSLEQNIDWETPTLE